MDRTVAEFAKKIGVSRKTVYEWVKMGGLPPNVSCRVHLRRLIIEDNSENKRDDKA